MALIKCPECGKEISDKATQCMYCGAPMDALRDMNEQTKVQSIEQIHKSLRLQTIFGMILFLIGMVTLIREIIKGHHGVFFIFGIGLMAVGTTSLQKHCPKELTR
jgi:uncharacterized membrane protein YvbJ